METLLHPMLVHFPIALLMTSVLFDAVGAWLTRESLREAALWTLVLGLLAGVAAFAAGDMAAEAAERAGVPESLIETHEHLAGATLGVFGALLVWRLLLRNRFSPRTRIAYLMVAIVGLGLLSATGHYGGSLVYDHGVGVNAAAARTAHLAETVSHR